MRKEIVLGARRIEYTYTKSKRARRIRLAVRCDGTVTLTAPFGLFQERLAEEFLRKKADWVFGKLAQIEQRKKSGSPVLTKHDFAAHKEKARAFMKRRVEHFHSFYKFPYNRITIRDQKTRWGSCSKNGNLSFSYKLIFLPQQLADYIIVHEMCHLKELNHSVRFWDLVSRVFPDYKELRKALKEQSVRLG